MIGGDVPLNVNFALSKLLLGAVAVLSRIVANAVFASQLLQWNITGRLKTWLFKRGYD